MCTTQLFFATSHVRKNNNDPAKVGRKLNVLSLHYGLPYPIPRSLSLGPDGYKEWGLCHPQWSIIWEILPESRFLRIYKLCLENVHLKSDLSAQNVYKKYIS